MDKLCVCVVSETLRHWCLPDRLSCRRADDSIVLEVVSVSSLGAARPLFPTLPIACLVVPVTFRSETTAPFLEGFRAHHPKIPIIIYGKAAASSLNAGDGANTMLVSSIHPDRLLGLAVRLLQERAFRLEGINPCAQCTEPCSSYWPQKLVKYLLEHHNFLQLKSVQEVAYHFNGTVAYLDRMCSQNCPLPLKQLLLAMKLSLAAYPREATTLSMEHIATSCGLTDGHHLSRLFGQKIGLPLSVYPFRHSWREVFPALVLIYKRKARK